MKFCILTPIPQREKLGGFLVANVLSYFPKENGLKFVTPQTSENFTTFSTARKEIYHLELALGATSRNVSGFEHACACFRPSKHITEALHNGLGIEPDSMLSPTSILIWSYTEASLFAPPLSLLSPISPQSLPHLSPISPPLHLSPSPPPLPLPSTSTSSGVNSWSLL